MNIASIFKKHRSKLFFTLFLTLLETAISILFPLFMGYAIEDALENSYKNAVYLGILGTAALLIGVFRRVYDSRFYAKIYQQLGSKIIAEMENDTSSKKSARLNMIRELIEFFENSMPELISTIIGLLGVIGIIATLNLTVFYGSLFITFLVYMVYWITTSKTTALNKAANDEFEKQVNIIDLNNPQELSIHLKKMMKWNIKLSDLEATNFSITWIILVFFLIFSIVISANDSVKTYGVLLALIMYVFQYIENVVNLPFFYQNWLRLKEIQHRINRL